MKNLCHDLFNEFGILTLNILITRLNYKYVIQITYKFLPKLTAVIPVNTVF